MSDNAEKKVEYYICSNKHTDGLTRTFWRENGCGYTIDLKQAGLYSLEYSKEYPLVTKDDISKSDKYETFYIKADDIHLLGLIMTCVLN